VGSMIVTVAKHLGINVKHSMSRRTVGRAILEGGVAAQVQIGYELAHAQSKTVIAVLLKKTLINI